MPQLPVRSSISRVATATFQSAVRAWPCSSMVSAITAAPCSTTSGMTRAIRESGPVAVLVVDRVHHRPAGQQLQPGPDHLRLGGVDHQRQRGRGGQPAGHLGHVGRRRPGRRSPRTGRAGARRPGSAARAISTQSSQRPVDERLAERLGPVGVGPLADGQERRCPAGTARAGRARPPRARAAACAAATGRAAQPLHHGGQVLRRGAAAAADQGQAELGGEPLVRVGQLGRGERVPGAVGGELRQAGVGHAGQRDARVAGQVAQVLAHLARPGRAVQPDQADAERLQRGERGADLAAQQHGARWSRSSPGRSAGAGPRPRPWPAARR